MTKVKAGYYADMPHDEYREAEGVCNSDLLLLEKRPSSVKQSKTAPRDPSKTGAADYGTIVHTALLEPEKFEGSFVIGPTKSRETKAFMEFEQQPENHGKLILLEHEYDQLRLTVDCALADPTMEEFLRQHKFDAEASIFVQDERLDIMRKIRIDANYVPHGLPIVGDMKSSAGKGEGVIETWSSPIEWKNPLFSLNYGHGAAFYLDTASLHYGESIDSYYFLIIGKTADFGVYPVDVREVTRQELIEYGFFERMTRNLEEYAERLHTDNWKSISRFPVFGDKEPEKFEYVEDDAS
ncbi:MAG: putative exodeoxyribonuclease 8 [Prokaryotic dsDNA virus sp.]|nr:MAG: putative exodeoxyribonuclease 8 [Prokaryotic dsDNA virus sp.]